MSNDRWVRPALREALLMVTKSGGKISGSSLGRWLGAQRGRIVGGFMIEEVGKRQGYTVWRITPAGGAA